MATKTWAIIIVLLSTLLTSTAQILYKFGVKDLSFAGVGAIINSVITNVPLLTGLGLYIIGAVIMVIALKGGDLSTIYPLIAASYIWVCLASPHFFPNDSMNALKWTGIFSIIAGVSLIGFGSDKGNKGGKE